MAIVKKETSSRQQNTTEGIKLKNAWDEKLELVKRYQEIIEQMTEKADAANKELSQSKEKPSKPKKHQHKQKVRKQKRKQKNQMEETVR